MSNPSPSSDDNDSDTEPSLEDLTKDLSHHIRSTSAHGVREVKCCCGRDKCEFLRRSRTKLEELESQVRLAGSLGQALLKRHERTMVEAESQRSRMVATISELEMKTEELERDNTKTVEENKQLLHALDDLNTNMTFSETKVKELQEDLDTTHEELARLSARAARTEVLEAQLAVLESEQEELRNTLTTTKEEEKAAVAKWRKAERTVLDLEEQLERIEREHELEKVRTKNILERMEQRKVGRPLGGRNPATILPEKAAMTRFIKEILAENGHLQVGVSELQEMLAASQEEVNMLRQKLESLSAIGTEEGEGIKNTILSSSNSHAPLSAELARSPSGTVQTIVHHHHYHPPPQKEKPAPRAQIRRPRRRKNAALEAFSPISSRFSGPSGTSSPPVAETFAKRWSAQSRFTIGTGISFPVSPTSTFQDSIFDRALETESSRPTSADSNYYPPMHSGFAKHHPRHMHGHHESNASFGPPFPILHTTMEEVPSEAEAGSTSPQRPTSPSPVRPSPRRSVSHESILSVVENTYIPSPSLSLVSSNISSRSPNLSLTAKPHDPQAVVTPDIAIRDANNQWKDSAYSRLLGLHQDHTALLNPLARKPSSNLSTATGGWLWKWGSSVAESTADDGKASVRAKPKKPITRPMAGYVDEDLLKESLLEGAAPHLS